MYTEEQEKKIDYLREQRELEREKKNANNTHSDFLKNQNRLGVGDPVFITIDGKTISGRIVGSHGNYVFDVNTPYGRITDISAHESKMCKRFVEDLSHVKVPEELKTMSTHRLLKLLQDYRCGNFEYWGTPKWTKEQLKAELMLRPHVPTKGEKRIFTKRIKKK
jgi:hypothetical protein